MKVILSLCSLVVVLSKRDHRNHPKLIEQQHGEPYKYGYKHGYIHGYSKGFEIDIYHKNALIVCHYKICKRLLIYCGKIAI